MLSSFSILFLNILWIHYLYSEFNMNRLSFSWIHYESINFTLTNYRSIMLALYVLRIHYGSIIFSRIHLKFPICSANSRQVYYLIRDFANFFAKSLLIHYFFRAPYFSRNVIRDELSFSRILNVTRKHYEFTICVANLLWIYYKSVIFRVFNMT